MVREGRDPFHLLAVPPNSALLKAAQRAILQDSLKTDTIGRLVAQDPVLLLELCRTVSSSAYARADSVNIQPPGQMITLLGVQAVKELFQSLERRTLPDIPELLQCLEESRLQCLRISGIARLIGSAVDPSLSEQCALIALFGRFGDLIAAMYLGNDFVEACKEESSRAKLAYRLAKNHAFDLEKAGIRYLSLHGLPEKVLACIDRDSQIGSSDLINRKLVVLSSMEVWAVYQESKWDRYAPDKALPVRSFLRPLKFLGMGYEKLYQDLSAYFEEPVSLSAAGLDGGGDGARGFGAGAGGSQRSSAGQLAKGMLPAGSDEIETGVASRLSLSFLGKFNPPVVACVRGIRNAENLFSAGQQASMREAVLRLLCALVKNCPDWEAILKRAAKTYHPLTFLDTEDFSLKEIVEVLSPKEISAVIALSYFYGEFERRCNADGWQMIRKELLLEVELGRLVGSLFEVVGPGSGMLLAGVRRLSLATILFHDPKGFQKYIEHLGRGSRPFDLVYERSKWDREHISFCGPILQGAGFGIEMTRAFEGFGNIPQIIDIKSRLCAVVPRWVENIRECGSAAGNPELLKQFGVGKDEAFRIDAEVKRLLTERQKSSWLRAVRGNVTE